MEEAQVPNKKQVIVMRHDLKEVELKGSQADFGVL